MVSKVRNVRLGVFSGGGCHHPNVLKRPKSHLCITIIQPHSIIHSHFPPSPSTSSLPSLLLIYSLPTFRGRYQINAMVWNDGEHLEGLILNLQVLSFYHTFSSLQLISRQILTLKNLGGEGEDGEGKGGKKSC